MALKPVLTHSRSAPFTKGSRIALASFACWLLIGCGAGRPAIKESSSSAESRKPAATPGLPLTYTPPESALARQPRQTDDCSVVLYGDSILRGGYGGNSRLTEPPEKTLRRLRPKYRIDDRTANGETATQRSKRFRSESRSSHFVVIAHGINDVAGGIDPAPPVRQMVESAQAEGRVVILTGLSRQLIFIPGRVKADQAIGRVAVETRAKFADWGSVPYKSSEMADVLHPAKAYSDRLVERLVATLDSLAPACAP